jgi:tricarballylate dehydrogenase
LVRKVDNVNAGAALSELTACNAAVQTHVPFNATIKDGRGMHGLAVNKSNRANTLDASPFEAYAVTCGITFTFGGLRITTDAQVVSTTAFRFRAFTRPGSSPAAPSTSPPGGTGLQRGGIRPHRGRSSGIGDSQVGAWPSGETVVEAPLPAPALV